MPFGAWCWRNHEPFFSAKLNHMHLNGEADNSDGLALAPDMVNPRHEITEGQWPSPDPGLDNMRHGIGMGGAHGMDDCFSAANVSATTWSSLSSTSSLTFKLAEAGSLAPFFPAKCSLAATIVLPFSPLTLMGMAEP